MDQHHDHDEATTEDDALLAAAGRLRDGIVGHPAAIWVFAVAAVIAIVVLGVSAGESVYGAFDGDGTMAAIFGATFVAVLVAIIAVGVLFDRRQRARDADTTPLTDAQSARLRAYLKPTSPLVQAYQPVAVAVFFALATPGVLLFDTPWDGLWVLVVLIANPVARWLRAQGHVLTTRDLGFAIPGLSHWPSIANAAVAATVGMAVAVLLWAEALDTNLATTATGIVLLAIIIGGGLSVNRHQRRHIARLLDQDADDSNGVDGTAATDAWDDPNAAHRNAR